MLFTSLGCIDRVGWMLVGSAGGTSQMSWINQYAEHGYAVLENLLPHDLIEKHLAKYWELVEPLQMYERGAFQAATDERKLEYNRRLDILHYEHEPTLQLAMGSRLRDLVAELFEEEPVYDIPMTGIWGPGIPAHRDTAMVFRDPIESVCRTWSAMEDLHPDCGLPFVVPGTHKQAYDYDNVLDQHPELLSLLRSTAESGYTFDEGIRIFSPSIENHRRKVISEMEGKEKVLMELKKGDTLIFNPGLIHGSLAPVNLSLTRKFFIAEWSTRGTQYYPPTAYFGSRHDFRGKANALPRMIEESKWGPLIRRDPTAAQMQTVKPIELN